MRGNVVIKTDGLGRRFGDAIAVDQLSLQVQGGEVFGFLGHNGAGKTTTVRLLNGVLGVSEGTVEVLGLSPVADGPQLRRRTGVLTETPSLDERLTARENLMIYADLFGVPKARVARRVEELLGSFELAERADERVSAYSKGMKQRLALARALVNEPELLFLDEPTSGLDPVSVRQVHQLIDRMSRGEGRTVFLCTHNLAEAQKLCDRVAVMEHGRLVALGTPAELATQVGYGLRLEIEVAPGMGQQAVDVLGRLSLPARFAVDGGNMINGTGVGHESIPEVIATLVNANVRVYQVAQQDPSLEDVYFALYENAEVEA